MQKRDGLKRIFLLLTSLVFLVTTIIIPLNSVNANVLPSKFMTILNKGVSRLDPEADDCITYPGAPGSCSELAELRTEMWESATDKSKQRFMGVVKKENYGLAAVEAYMNQVISKYGNSGNLEDWLNSQCVAFMAGGTSTCNSPTEITLDDQDLIDEALGGSNVTNFALDNATGGSDVGAGKITCVWKDGKCRDDVDLTIQDGRGKCSVYSPSESFGECWGRESGDDWAEEMEEKCSKSSTESGGVGDIMSAKNASKSLSSIDAPPGDSGPEYFQWMVDNFGDLAARTANEYNLSAIGILAQGSIETHFQHGTGKQNNFWGLTKAGGGFLEISTLGESFQTYGEFTHNGNFDAIIGKTDPLEYIRALRSTNWCVGECNVYADSVVRPIIEAIEATGYKGDASANYCVIDGDFTDDNTFSFYLQCDKEWGALPYGTGNMCSSSCGITSFAMAATALLGRPITPTDTRKVMLELNSSSGVPLSQNTISSGFVPQMADYYGIKYELIEQTTESVNNALKQGKMVHVSGAGSTPFTAGGHYILLRGVLSNGKWKIGDSASDGNSVAEWDPQTIASSGWHGPPAVALWR